MTMMTADYQSVERGQMFIEHFGKKGMRWGIRNKNDSVNTNQSSGNHLSVHADHKSRNKKIALAAGGIALVGGAAVVAIILKRKSSIKMKDVRASKAALEQTRRLLQQNKIVKVSNLHYAKDTGAISSDHAKRIAKLYERDYVNGVARKARSLKLNPHDFVNNYGF